MIWAPHLLMPKSSKSFQPRSRDNQRGLCPAQTPHHHICEHRAMEWLFYTTEFWDGLLNSSSNWNSGAGENWVEEGGTRVASGRL